MLFKFYFIQSTYGEGKIPAVSAQSVLAVLHTQLNSSQEHLGSARGQDEVKALSTSKVGSNLGVQVRVPCLGQNPAWSWG